MKSKILLYLSLFLILFSCTKDNNIFKDVLDHPTTACYKRYYHETNLFQRDTFIMTCNTITWNSNRTTDLYQTLSNDTIVIYGVSSFFDTEIWHFYPTQDSMLERRIMWGTSYYYMWYKF